MHHPLVMDTRSLLWMANQNCITPHVWTSRAPKLSVPDLCVFDLDPADEDLDVLRAADARAPRSARGARPAELGEDVRLQRVPHRRAARREGRLRRRCRIRRRGRGAAGQARSPASDAGIQQGRSRAGGFTSTPAATATARRSRRRTQSARSRARRCPRRARGKKSSAARCTRDRSRCGTWPIASLPSATYGPICRNASGRWRGRPPSCGS